jgi:uncharacterized membrane protein YdjX (TVP38/TMEM64 family)
MSEEAKEPAKRNSYRRWAMLAVALAAAVILPFLLFEDRMTAFALAVTQAMAEGGLLRWAGALALAGLLAGDILLPVPSSLVSTACGALLGFLPGMLVSAAGMTASCAVGYRLGRALAAGRALGIVSAQDLRAASAPAERYGHWAVVVLRGVPVLAEVSVVLAGMGGMPFRRFMGMTFLANLGISAAYALAGSAASDGDSFLLPFAASLGLPALAWLVFRRRPVIPTVSGR